MWHWLQFWQLRTWIHDNLCNLTINCDNEQHSQFLRCLALTSLTKVNAEQLMFPKFPKSQLMFPKFPKFPKLKPTTIFENNFWPQWKTSKTCRKISVCWNFGDPTYNTPVTFLSIENNNMNNYIETFEYKMMVTAFAIHIHTTVLLQYMYFNLLLQYI